MPQRNRRRRAAISAWICALVLIPFAVRAQDPVPAPAGDIEAMDLESLLNLPVVTSGGGRSESRAMASANVELVTRDDISRRGYQSIGELLSGALGVYTIDDMVNPSVGVRGISGGLRAGSRLIKVMINGTAVNYRPDLTAFLGPEFIPMEAVDRVEIAKGPLSALYGANAFIAVVNVITRTPTPGVNAELAARGYDVRGHGGGAGSGMVGFSGEGHSLVGAYSSAQIDRSGVQMTQTFSTQNTSAQVMGAQSQN
ncbi:MAG TPA: TonB-dependent receptor plug domain-containing protein, partial [Myxococcales bacterium]|nr:TonB-dependent receptor plug domain-containing protein [Myxococcales bacterium]